MRKRTAQLLCNCLVLLLFIAAASASWSNDNDRRLQRNDTCPPCPNQCLSNTTNSNATEPLVVQILVVDSQGIVDMVAWNARDYERHVGNKIKVEIKKAPTMPALFEEIENDARSGGGLFDAYFTNPVVLGSAAVLGGFLDLTSFVKESPYADWTDVLLALRTYVTSFEDSIYIILLDGDTHTLFYRKDVLQAFNLTAPRTWNEYTNVAQKVHGKVFNNITLSGSCVSRIQGDHAMYWYHLVLSSITQTHGTDKGSLFDTADMTPLTGEAVAEMLRIHEEQGKYGTYDEFEKVINLVQNAHMNDGSCVLTYMWGDMFRRSKAEGSVLHDKLGIAPTPGSEWVLNRKTGQLERCNRENCPYAKYYDDIGFVNSASYAANGGWGCAISANTTPEKQKALADFFLWASSKEQSLQYVIPNATLPWYLINGQDPWRKSQLDVDKWEARGFDRELSKQFVDSILTNLVSKNVVVEARFPKAGAIMSVLDKEVNEHLVRAPFLTGDLHEERLKVAQSITDQWNQIIKDYDARGDSVAPILEIYQRLRGVYVPNEKRNHLTNIRPVGLTLMAIILASSVGAATWVLVKRNTKVVKASQPIFLGLICLGTLVMGSAIFPMGVDDGVASQSGCNVACMITPWLVAVGFTICFAALFSKIWRLNILMKSAAQYRKIEVTVQDVLLPFCVLLFLNVVFLLVWTLVDPLYWQRVSQGRTEAGEIESYGRCTSSGTTSLVMLGLIIAVNVTAVVLAIFQAYQTRNLRVAYNESQFVGLCMVSILQAILVGVPLLFLSNSNPTARYVVRSVLVFVICESMLGFIFVPKILRKGSEDSTRLRVSWAGSLPSNGQMQIQASAHQRPNDFLSPSTEMQPQTTSVRQSTKVMKSSPDSEESFSSLVQASFHHGSKSSHAPKTEMQPPQSMESMKSSPEMEDSSSA